jgi:hypothetical protein
MGGSLDRLLGFLVADPEMLATLCTMIHCTA